MSLLPPSLPLSPFPFLPPSLQTGMRPVKQEQTFEEGTYFYFDVNLWRKSTKEFHVEYDKLEDRPPIPSSLHVLTGTGLTAS